MEKVICIVGSDGAGKTTIARCFVNEIEKRGQSVACVWMRFNNFFSKVLLAFARIYGYSHFKYVSGIKMGFHDFEKVWWLRWPFAFLQMIDVNIAAWLKLHTYRKSEVLVFERSAWDTLSDVMADTGIRELDRTWIGRGIVKAFNKKSTVFWIDRDMTLIRKSRIELNEDYKLNVKIANYQSMADYFGWIRIDNNRSIDEAVQEMLNHV